jgi:hypothetical protein
MYCVYKHNKFKGGVVEILLCFRPSQAKLRPRTSYESMKGRRVFGRGLALK